jgi:hypothetical protein
MCTVQLPPGVNSIAVNKYIKWQHQWEETTKGAITKELFPSVERSNSDSKLKPKSNNNNNRAWKYSIIHRLKIIESPECPCKHGIQRVDHLIFECNMLKNEREALKTSVIKAGNWPVNKSELTNRYLKQLIRYINSNDLEKINQSLWHTDVNNNIRIVRIQ